MPGMVDEQPAGEVGREAEDRADREVDVAGDDHDRLADREEQQDRRREQQVAQAVGAEQEGRVLDRGRPTITSSSASRMPVSRAVASPPMRDEQAVPALGSA